VTVDISDPSRTVLDLLSEPRLGGGIRSAADMVENYLRSDQKNLPLLLTYANKLGNGAALKRLGFLLERLSPGDRAIIDQCRSTLTKGNVKLDPRLPADRLVTRWRLWIPSSWSQD